MSQISTSQLSPALLASSVSGGQQARPGRNEAAKQASQRDFQSDLASLTAKETEDVGETNLDADRDADGRSLLGNFHSEEQDLTSGDGNDELNGTSKHRPGRDLDENLGQFLDLDA